MLLITSKLNAVEEEEKGWKQIFLTTFVMEIEQTITKIARFPFHTAFLRQLIFLPINQLSLD